MKIKPETNSAHDPGAALQPTELSNQIGTVYYVDLLLLCKEADKRKRNDRVAISAFCNFFCP